MNTYRTSNGLFAWAGSAFVNDLSSTHHVSLEHMQEGGALSVFMQRGGAAGMVLHLPSGAVWSSGGSNPAHLGAGGIAVVSRNVNVFHIQGAAITFSAATFPTVSDYVVTAGQSMMTGLENFPGKMLAQVPGTGLIGTAAGGSSLYPPDASGYWIETDNTTPGPLLSAALTAISGKTISHILWAQGHDNRDELESGTLTEAQYKAGVLAVLTQLGWNSSGTGTPVIIEMPGRIPLGNGGGWQSVRNVYQQIVATYSDVRGYEVYDLDRKDGTHLTDAAQEQAAHRVGLLLANTSFEPPSPTVTVLSESVTKVVYSEPVEWTDFQGGSLHVDAVRWNGDMNVAVIVHDPGTFRYPWREGLGLAHFSRGQGPVSGQFAIGGW